MRMLLLLYALLFSSSLVAGEAKLALHLLDYTELKETKSSFSLGANLNRGIVDSRLLTGNAAKDMIDLVRGSLLDHGTGTFCGHDPIYGLDWTDVDGKAVHLSLCFKCGTVGSGEGPKSISGKRGIENPLCLELRKLIELPKEILLGKPFKNAKELAREARGFKNERPFKDIGSTGKIAAQHPAEWRNWISSLTIPKFKFAGTLQEAVEELGQASKVYGVDDRSMVGIVLKGVGLPERKLSVDMQNVGALRVLDQICREAGAEWCFGPFGISIEAKQEVLKK